MTELRVAVRDLVAFCHRSGDIDHRFTASPTGEQGIEGHRRLYRRRPATYRSEYPVSCRQRFGDLELLLVGRADGYDPVAGLVEEIKTCRVPAAAIPEQVSRRHLAQARLYGALIAREAQLDELCVRLTWFNIDSGAEQALEQHYRAPELEQFLQQTLQRFAHWMERLAARRRARDLSVAQLPFPYGAFRAGQRGIAERVYKCIDQGGQLMIEAPTGLGKTAAVLFPALKALANGKHDRLLFITAKTVGRRAAENALRDFAAAGLSAPALTLTARERVCLAPGRACSGEDCPYARGYYDRLPAAMDRAIDSPLLGRAEIEAIAREFEVCPYQLSLDLLPWSDVVIADIHYLYSLGGVLSGMARQDGGRWTALVDEAHNLPPRARSLYGARLAKRDLMAVKRTAPGGLKPALDRLNRALLALQRDDWSEPDFDSRDQLPGEFIGALRSFAAAVGEQLAQEPVLLARRPPLADFYFQVLQLLRVADQWGAEYRFELHRGEGRQGLEVALNCLDPGRLLAERQSYLHSVTAFSATLSPPAWVRASLGFSETAVYRREESPFASDQLQVYLATGIDTRYRHRQDSLPALASLVRQWLERETGNCIVYFPSYSYLQACLRELDRIGPAGPERTRWVQERLHGDEGRAGLLQLLEERRDVAAFCILGGVFGEGIDLPGRRLSSVVVVGVGLPQVNRETEQLRRYYESTLGAGFEYAYLYPGLQKVDQALGRVVRRPEDRGKALLIDRRYGQPGYRALLPPWWSYRVLRENNYQSGSDGDRPLHSRSGNSMPPVNSME
jgi:DNA excision repair protein ERCC-2